MQLGLFFILLSTASAQAQSLQQKIDNSVLDSYNSTTKSSMDVVSVQNGYLMSKTGLKEYVSVQDEKFNAEVRGQALNEKSVFSGLKDIFDAFTSLKKKAQTYVSPEKIEQKKANSQVSLQSGNTLRNILASYRTAQPLKITSTNVCSTTGPKLEAFYKQEKFSLSQVEVKNQPAPTHVTQIQFKENLGQETEEYLQTGSFQLPVYETYKYQMLQKDKIVRLLNAKQGPTMLKQFLQPTGQITKADLPELNQEVEKAWYLLKRVGACCNESVCKQAMTSTGAVSPQGSSGTGKYVN